MTGVIIGPFARLRPDNHLKAGARIGNFVELKKSTIGESLSTTIADARAGFQVIVRTQSREGANDDAVIEAALRDDAMRLDGHVVAEDCIGQYASRFE